MPIISVRYNENNRWKNTSKRITNLKFLNICTPPQHAFPAGMKYSENIRWVFPQRGNVSDIQGTFGEHFKGKYFLKNYRFKSCFCLKNVWLDDNKCWSFGKFQ